MSADDALEIPTAAHEDSRSCELLRVWIANKQQHVALRVGAWKDPAAWGIMLCDLMKHIANAYHHEDGRDTSVALQRIKAGLEAELANATDS
ncbi:hypothetical protein RAS2_26250 [Phycisphaerae bacterium RAS2]|nr:hypothetical protein RAS2_26250 [Phycisphaerae bacterium RAS2]